VNPIKSNKKNFGKQGQEKPGMATGLYIDRSLFAG
jgi:hypothetical protein